MMVKWKDMTPAQRIEATRLRPRWDLDRFADFEFWIKADGHVSRRGGHHSLTEEAYQLAIHEMLYGGVQRKPDEPHAFNSGTTFTVSKG